MALFPPLAASGGEDDRAFVWEAGTGVVKLACSGHRDSVTMVKVNGKGTLLATGDMSGLVKIWRLADFALETDLEEATELEWLTWHPSAGPPLDCPCLGDTQIESFFPDILFAGTGDGSIWMWLVPTRNVKVFAGQGFPCTSG